MTVNVPRVVVVGSINCDFTTYVTSFPQTNETVMGTRSALALGGKGLNQAIAAARAGARVDMVACVGADQFGQLARDHLKAHRVGVTHLHVTPAAQTGTACILVDDSANNEIAVTPGANAFLSIDHVLRAESLIATADVLIVQLEVPFAVVRKSLEIAKHYGVPTVVNPAPATREALELVSLATVLTPNETEMELLSGIYPDSNDNISRGLETLHRAGAELVVVTLGAQGCGYFLKGGLKKQSAFPVTAVDPTGAGDVFNGVLAVALATSKLLHFGDSDAELLAAAVSRASAAAALSVMRSQAEGAAPMASEIDAFLENAHQHSLARSRVAVS